MVRFNPSLEPDDARVRGLIESANGRGCRTCRNVRGLIADINGDGNVDMFDYLDFVAQYNTECV